MALASPPLPSSPAALGTLLESVRPVSMAGGRLLPVVPPLAALLPGGGLRRGSTVAVAGSMSLALALLAGPSAAGSWCAVVGVPSLGLLAAAEFGVVLGRLALVAAPGRQWASVVATLLDALDVVVARPPERVRPGDARRLVARASERGSVLVPLGRWDGADVRLSVAASSWEGLGDGAGHLRARRMKVVAEGRGAAARPRRASLWLPSPEGTIALATPVAAVASHGHVASAAVASDGHVASALSPATATGGAGAPPRGEAGVGPRPGYWHSPARAMDTAPPGR